MESGCPFWILFITLVILDIHDKATSDYVIKESYQSSTNGSYNASLGCDGDMDTFSMTNAGDNESWSIILDESFGITWMFVSIRTGSYEIDIKQGNGISKRFASIKKPSDDFPEVMEIILTHKPVYKLGDRINVQNVHSGFVQIFEITILGQYEIHISNGNTSTDSSTLCKAFGFAGVKQEQTAIQCDKAMSGDTVIVKKTDNGALRLFEVYPIVCPENQFGPNCARCRQSCRSCDSVTGECNQCNGPYYGDFCQNGCPANCLNLTCDQRIGSCNGCIGGYKGKTCEQYTGDEVDTVGKRLVDNKDEHHSPWQLIIPQGLSIARTCREGKPLFCLK